MENELTQVCLALGENTPALVGMILTGVVTLFSVLSNVVSKDSGFGKFIHWMALNFTTNKPKV